MPHSHRYRITPAGAQVAMFYARLYTRALRPACSLQPTGSARAQRVFDRLDAALAQLRNDGFHVRDEDVVTLAPNWSPRRTASNS